MKKLLSLLPLLFAACATRSEKAPEAARVYNAPRAIGLITVDGILDEADWANAPLSEAFADIRGVDYDPAPVKQTHMKMLWDDDFLYIAGIIEEDNVTGSLTERDDIIYHDNDFEVFIDPDGDGHNYFEIEVNALGTVMDLLMDRPYTEGGTFIMPWDVQGLQVAVSVDGTLNDASPDRGWTVEMAIPFAALMVGFNNPKDLQDWHINFSRVEWLKEGGPEENWVWAPTGVVDMHQPSRWGVLHFNR